MPGVKRRNKAIAQATARVANDVPKADVYMWLKNEIGIVPALRWALDMNVVEFSEFTGAPTCTIYKHERTGVTPRISKSYYELLEKDLLTKMTR